MDSTTPTRINTDIFANEAIRTGKTLDIGSLWKRSYALVMSDFGNLLAVSFIASLCMQVIVLNFLVLGGLFYYFIGRVRNQRRELADLFIGFNQMTSQLILVGIAASCLSSVGFILCIIPGIYLVLIWMFCDELVVDKHLQFWDAMEVSRKVVHHQFGNVLILFLVNSLIMFVGLLCCFIGVLFVVPFVYTMIAFAYDDLFGGMQYNKPQPELTF
jgi:uncharacterized membrane protein